MEDNNIIGADEDQESDSAEHMMRLHTSHNVVEKEKCSRLKGDFGCAKAGLIRLDGQVGLLKKCNFLLERKCDDMKATV